MISQGDVCWASLPQPVGSGPGGRRPVVVIQGNGFNSSGLATAIVIPLTGNLRWAAAPGNLVLPARLTGLPRDSVANVSQIHTVDREQMEPRTGQLGAADVARVLAGLDVALGRA